MEYPLNNSITLTGPCVLRYLCSNLHSISYFLIIYKKMKGVKIKTFKMDKIFLQPFITVLSLFLKTNGKPVRINKKKVN